MKNTTENSYVQPSFQALLSEICELYPDSVSYAFKLGHTPNKIYFLIKVDKLYPATEPSDVRSISSCVVVDLKERVLTVEDVRIRNKDKITAMKNREFRDKVLAVMRTLENAKRKADLENFEKQGFKLGFNSH